MRVGHHARGKFYTIECPEGTRLVRAEQNADGEVAESEDFVDFGPRVTPAESAASPRRSGG